MLQAPLLIILGIALGALGQGATDRLDEQPLLLGEGIDGIEGGISGYFKVGPPSWLSLVAEPSVEAWRESAEVQRCLQLNRTADARLFYQLFPSRRAPTDPLLLWMTGGPGCSSALALFYGVRLRAALQQPGRRAELRRAESGPVKINTDLSLRTNPWSWNNQATVVYVVGAHSLCCSRAPH